MRWTPGRSSGDVVDRRGASGFRGGGLKMGLGGTVILLILSLVFGRDFLSLADTSTAPPGQMTGEGGPVVSTPAEDSLYQFVDWVVGDAQDAWTRIFQQAGAPYQRAKVVVYRDLYLDHMTTHLNHPQYWAEDYYNYAHWVAQFGVYAISQTYAP